MIGLKIFYPDWRLISKILNSDENKIKMKYLETMKNITNLELCVITSLSRDEVKMYLENSIKNMKQLINIEQYNSLMSEFNSIRKINIISICNKCKENTKFILKNLFVTKTEYTKKQDFITIINDTLMKIVNCKLYK